MNRKAVAIQASLFMPMLCLLLPACDRSAGPPAEAKPVAMGEGLSATERSAEPLGRFERIDRTREAAEYLDFDKDGTFIAYQAGSGGVAGTWKLSEGRLTLKADRGMASFVKIGVFVGSAQTIFFNDREVFWEASRPQAYAKPRTGPKSPPPNQKTFALDLDRGVKIEFVRIEPGEFMMGDEQVLSTSQPSSQPSDARQHQVRISRPFYIGKQEVTQAQWQALMGENPSHFKGADLPVETVSWDDCREYCLRLSFASGWTVRLPTEAEWEYACRAGGTGRYSFGDSDDQLGDYAWYDENAKGTPHPVGTKRPNAWGLYDMHGNVWEWCADWHGPYSADPQVDPRGPANGHGRVLRGGSWDCNPSACRSANRLWFAPGHRVVNYGRGLRVVVVVSSGTP